MGTKMDINSNCARLNNYGFKNQVGQSDNLCKNIVRIFNCCGTDQSSFQSENYITGISTSSLVSHRPAKTIQVFTHNNANRKMSKSMCDSIVSSCNSDILFISTEEMKNLSGAMKDSIGRSQYVIVYNSAQKMLTVTKPKELLSLISCPASTAQITLVKKGVVAPVVIDHFTYRDMLNNPNKGGTVTIQKVGDMKVAMVNIHLDSRDQDERKKEINDILNKIKNKHNDINHIIVAGDFNTRNRNVQGHLIRALQDEESFRTELGIPQEYSVKLPTISQQENTYKWDADVNAEAKSSRRQRNGEMQSGYLDGVAILTPRAFAKEGEADTGSILPVGKSVVGSSFGSDHRAVTAEFTIDS
ncbi:hypothetical protein GCM10007938_14520 [Vibrio zhanjiangensis]|uniref:Inositol polyphosphate-related phosphatase domain-containing protein n=2 Tax=Vibrio zhanjiangensis TaxID=1046128 RepID=A0ABQ6EXX4_9VIBR|nr:hypothetical protein GCM10007938_14520 [Vibrio zhanjiangensis]